MLCARLGCCLISCLLLSCVTTRFGGGEATLRAPVLVAEALARELIETEAFYSGRRTELEAVEPGAAQPSAYLEKEVVELLDETERRLAAALEGRGLVALADFFRAEVAEAKLELAPDPGAPAASAPDDAGGPDPAPARRRAKPLLEKSSADPVLDRLLDKLRRVIDLAQDDDLELDLCIETFPADAKLWLYPLFRYPHHERTLLTHGWLPNVGRGVYVYRLKREGYPELRCLPDASLSSPGCGRLDLVSFDRPLVTCVLDPEAAPGGEPRCFVEEEPREGWTCALGGT